MARYHQETSEFWAKKLGWTIRKDVVNRIIDLYDHDKHVRGFFSYAEMVAFFAGVEYINSQLRRMLGDE